MMNISQAEHGGYQMMIAIPVNKELSDEGDFFVRKMVRGNFLVTDVKGGVYTINQAQRQVRLYMDDYKRTSMAIPFEVLITDRSAEPDSSKWVTRLYNPVM